MESTKLSCVIRTYEFSMCVSRETDRKGNVLWTFIGRPGNEVSKGGDNKLQPSKLACR